MLVVLFATVVTVCLSSCKNGTSSDKSDEKANVEASTSENGANQEAGAPLLNATDLMAVYDNLEDTTYFKKNLASKGFKPLLLQPQLNEEGVKVGDWFTEIWGYNFTLDPKKRVV
jgi:hypothetical protein